MQSNLSEIRHPEELSLCKPLDMEHLKFNYGEVRQAEEKKRRVTLAAMPSQCQRRDNFSNQDSPDRVSVESWHHSTPTNRVEPIQDN